MPTPIDSSTFFLSSYASGVKINIHIDIELEADEAYSTLYLDSIEMVVERSPDNNVYTPVDTRLLGGVSGLFHIQDYSYGDASAISGNTYYYRVKNTMTHVEVEGGPI